MIISFIESLFSLSSGLNPKFGAKVLLFFQICKKNFLFMVFCITFASEKKENKRK